jgi:cytochrome c peroxidase
LAGCSTDSAPEEFVDIDRQKLSIFGRIPHVVKSEDNPVTPKKVKLGRMLWYEKRMSEDGTVSCNSCHQLSQYGTDHKRVSRGVDDQKGPRNSPTVYNAAGQIAQFWDGRTEDVEEQARKPVLNPVEMSMPSKNLVEDRLRAIPRYVKLFDEIFPGDGKEAVTFRNMSKAIGAFERRLTTPGRWDVYLAGDTKALTPDEKRGLKTFIETGCTQCHSGPRLGGDKFRKAGLVEPWPNQEDQGRYEVTEKEEDRMVFKVPMLRNVAKTGPYFHDGSVDQLEEAIRMMAKHQLGKDLSDREVREIETFLKALTSPLPEDFIEKPDLPPMAEDAEFPKLEQQEA